jgi:hypothetical protein
MKPSSRHEAGGCNDIGLDSLTNGFRVFYLRVQEGFGMIVGAGESQSP